MGASLSVVVLVAALGVGGSAGSDAAVAAGSDPIAAARHWFVDVDEEVHPFGAEIAWAASEGVVGGYPDGTFRPTAPMTRQTFAAMLARWYEPHRPPQPAGGPPPTQRFTDVPVGHPFFAEIEAMAAAGVIDGYDDGRFGPTDVVTRQAAAAQLTRLAAVVDGHPPPDPSAPPPGDPVAGTTALPDVARAHPLLVEIHTAFGLGLVAGYPDGTFRPTVTVSRQIAAALFHRLGGWADPGYEPAWSPEACTVPTPAGRVTECGTLTVPEDRSDPTGAWIDLAVAVVHTNAATPAPDAGVYLGGGPGGTVMDSLPGRYKAVYGEARDVVLFDQRGVGLSEPNLDCPERDEALWDTYATAEPFADELEGLIAATEVCRDRLLLEGVDLDSYTSIESALDVRDLRRALGYEQWNLYGVSYGTSLAQQVVRADPFSTRSVVYDSTLPNLDLGPERLSGAADRVFEQLWAGCAADASCSAAHANLGAEFAATVAAYDDDPLPLTIPDPGGGPDRDLLLTGADLTGGLFAALYRTDLIPALPAVLTAAAGRDEATLELIAAEGLSGLTELVDGVFLSVECHDRPWPDGRAAVEDLMVDRPELGSLFFTAAFAYCETWGVPPGPAGFRTLPVSSVPSVVLAGSYDPITPPEGGQALDAALLHSSYAEFPRYGHGVLSSANTCAVSIVRALLTQPSTPPDTTCLAAELPPDFI
jgi:pimeloyl-ACP methyl ester carboxylesterase